MKEEEVFIGLSTTPRAKLKETITLNEFFKGIRNGTWADEVKEVRKYRPDDKRYDKAKKKCSAVWLQQSDLLVFDYDHGKLDVPDKLVLTKFKSVGGIGWVVILRTPIGLDKSERQAYRKAIQSKYNFKDNQHSDDRCRYVSFDPAIKINWDCEIDTGEINKVEEFKKSDWEMLMTGSLDNTTALSVYTGLRNQSMTHQEVVDQMQSLDYTGSKSMSTPKGRLKFFDKWSTQYEYPIPIKLGKGKATVTKHEEPEPVDLLDKVEDYYCTDDEQVDVMLQTLVSSFVPLTFQFLGKTQHVTTATVLCGPPSSGKGVINDMINQLYKELKEIKGELVKYIIQTPKLMGFDTENEEVDEKKIKKKMNNVALITEFTSSDAFMRGSLSYIRSMLLYGNEIGSLIGSTKKDHNSTRIPTLLSFIENETILSGLKANEHGASQFEVEDPLLSMLAGGTPSTIIPYFSQHIDDGLVSRLLFLLLRPTGREDKIFKKFTISDHVKAEEVLNWIKSGYKTIDVKYDEKYMLKQRDKLYDRYEDTLGNDLVRRGIRNCLKRAACQLWIDGERKKFVIPNKYIDCQVRMYIKSTDFVLEFKNHETDNYGNSILSKRIQNISKELVGAQYKLESPVKNGVSLSKKDLTTVIKYYNDCGRNIQQTARAFQTSRQSIYNWLNKYNNENN